MKKTAIAAMMLLAASAMVSCEKEPGSGEKWSGPLTINAVAEKVGAGTKAELALKYDVLWSESDQIYVTGEGGGDYFTLVDGAGTTKGTFVQDTPESIHLSGTVEGFYPADIVEQEGGPIFIWPAVQKIDQGAPMYCKKTLTGSETEEFGFSNLGAVMQIAFSTPQNDVILKSIEIKDGRKTMSGAFEISDGQALITATDGAGITLDLGDGLPVSVAVQYFNIAIPAGKYDDLTLIFTATDGRVCSMTSSTLPVVERNVVGKITLVGDFMDGIRLWEDGPSWAISNIGADSATGSGLYFSWGKTDGYLGAGLTFTHNHTFDSDPYYAAPTLEINIPLSPEYDAAQAILGDGWRLPTKDEFRDLLGKCDMTWFDGKEHRYHGSTRPGYLFSGRGEYKGKSVFFPAVGYGDLRTRYLENQCGFYWSSTYDSHYMAYALTFDSLSVVSDTSYASLPSISSMLDEEDPEGSGETFWCYRYLGYPIRPVKADY